jgi:hypothetical protein
MFLVLIFTRGRVEPRAMVRSEGNMSLKNPVTPPGIDPGTARIAAQHLNRNTTAGPCYFTPVQIPVFFSAPMITVLWFLAALKMSSVINCRKMLFHLGRHLQLQVEMSGTWWFVMAGKKDWLLTWKCYCRQWNLGVFAKIIVTHFG